MHETETSSVDICKQLSRLQVGYTVYQCLSVFRVVACGVFVVVNVCRLIVRRFKSGKTGILLLLRL